VEVKMLKWILNKGLRFQIMLILLLVLSVPSAVLVWNVLVPSNMRTVVKGMQEDRLKNLLIYIDDTIDKDKIEQMDENEEKTSSFEAEISSKMGTLSKAVGGTNIGIYLPESRQTYIFGMQHNGEHPARFKGIPENEEEQGLKESLNEVSQKSSDKAYYSNYKNKEIIRYFHPLIQDSRTIAVLFDENVLPPGLHNEKSALIYLAFLGPLGFILGLILMIAIVKNMNSNISKISKGLVNMSHDLSYRLEPMGGDMGKIAESINNMADSLERKEKVEEHLKRAEKLASLGQMISGVAHEIRNPLSIIRGTVQLMEKNFKGIEGLDEYVRIVKEQSDRENNVIQELLDYARPAKQQLLKMDVNQLIKGVLSFTNKYIQDKHVTLKLELAECLPETLIDPDKIKQVFVNIIINACEAMENGGSFSIKTNKEDKWVKISFEDTGTGMDDEELQKIFNPYYTTKPKGTGLGLAISNGIIELHGGFIEVESKKGKGSVFTVALPFIKNGGETIG
jgi:two-component system, NtrC family, sensor histidine kinase HydH